MQRRRTARGRATQGNVDFLRGRSYCINRTADAAAAGPCNTRKAAHGGGCGRRPAGDDHSRRVRCRARRAALAGRLGRDRGAARRDQRVSLHPLRRRLGRRFQRVSRLAGGRGEEVSARGRHRRRLVSRADPPARHAAHRAAMAKRRADRGAGAAADAFLRRSPASVRHHALPGCDRRRRHGAGHAAGAALRVPATRLRAVFGFGRKGACRPVAARLAGDTGAPASACGSVRPRRAGPRESADGDRGAGA